MRPLPAAMQAALDEGAATLCLCWKLMPRGRPPLGFTSHDRDVAFDGLTYRAASGFAASEIETSLGLAVDNTEVAGALSASDLTEEDLAAGIYDDARIEIWLVDWRDPHVRHLLRSGSIGRVSRGGVHFTAEIRGLSHYLNQTRGRVYAYGCDAAVGDARCGVDLSSPAFSAAATVAEARDSRQFTAGGLAAFASGWFALGRLTWTSGANAGRSAEIRTHSTGPGGAAHIGLTTPAPAPIAAGDAFTITAGCDRQFATCREKFANAENFRGFPHMPGNDFIMRYPNRDDTDNDGSALTD